MFPPNSLSTSSPLADGGCLPCGCDALGRANSHFPGPSISTGKNQPATSTLKGRLSRRVPASSCLRMLCFRSIPPCRMPRRSTPNLQSHVQTSQEGSPRGSRLGLHREQRNPGILESTGRTGQPRWSSRQAVSASGWAVRTNKLPVQRQLPASHLRAGDCVAERVLNMDLEKSGRDPDSKLGASLRHWARPLLAHITGLLGKRREDLCNLESLPAIRERGQLPCRHGPGHTAAMVTLHPREGDTGGNGAWAWAVWTEHSTLEASGRHGMFL